jgi:type IV pilus assembly protein PilY1
VTDLLALNTDPHTGTVDNFATDRINFLRGDRSQEQSKDASGNVTGKFRVRDSVLGDIINSAPVYYGAPSKNITGAGYSTFYKNYVNRQKAVYVGSNDGMLHAFDADNGTELFSYVPNALISKLNRLTDPYYSHQAFVDGRITVKEAQVKGIGKPY